MTILRHGRGAAWAVLAVASLATPAISLAAAPHYDGMWSVSIVTEKGDCDRGYRYPIRISNGLLANGGTAGISINGKVAPSGAITVTVSNGDKRATGSGRLAGNSGAGYWSGGACSGSWTAERRSS